MDENTLGVQAAAKEYFDKDVSEITASEAAVLAAMVDDPISDNPVSGQEANAEKRKIVLKAMLDEGYLQKMNTRMLLAMMYTLGLKILRRI